MSDAGDRLNIARDCIEPWAADPASRDRPAFTFARDYGSAENDETWTYGELWEHVERTGRGLLASGLESGDRVVIRLPHSPQYALAFFGATLAGLVPVPASPQLTAEEAAFVVADAEARAVVRTSALRVEGFAGIEIEGAALAALDGAEPLPRTAAEDPAFLIYTSGTTARPKGVLHAHRSLRGRALMRDAWQGFGPTDTTLHAGTLNWSYTLGVGLMDAWAAGAHAVLFGGEYDASGWPRLIERLAVSVFVAVPTVYRQLLKYGRPEQADLSSLRHVLCAGEALPQALREQWRARGGTEMYESLGMTEVSTYISCGPTIAVRAGSPGRPQPGRRVAILPADETAGNEPLPASEVGLLAVHRSDPGLMLGYWRRPDEEAAVFRGEWFTGGDLAAIDEDGYVWFHGRADDTIKSFGYRISPVEVEAAVESCAGVAEAAVVGVALDETKTLVTACVVRSPEAEAARIDERSLRAHVEQQLAEYKRPHEYRFLDALPRTANGKLRRRALRAEIEGGGS